MKCNFPFNVALSLAGRERVTVKETSSRPCLPLCLSAWRGRNHIVVFSECVCSLSLCCAACNSQSPRMVAHFAIEVAAVFPLVPDNDCLNRAHSVLSVYAGSIRVYSVYIFVYMLPVHWFISELHLSHCSVAFHANLLHKLCSSWVEKVPRNTTPPQQLLYFHSYLLRDGAGAVVPCPWPLPCWALSNPLPPPLSPFYFTLWAHAFISRHLTKAKSSHIVYLEADGHLYEINLYTHTHRRTRMHRHAYMYVHTYVCMYVCAFVQLILYLYISHI